MKQSLCIIDDYIPVEKYAESMDANEILNGNNFKHLLLEDDSWEDKNLLQFVKCIYGNEAISLTGFTSHEHFLNYSSNNIFIADIIVFDWDIAGQSPEDSKENLLEILKSMHCFIAVFTTADKEGEVTYIINSDEFREYRNRINVVKKEDEESAEKLIQIIEERIDTNFSLRFGKELISKSNYAINNALLELSNATINQIENYFKVTDDSKKDLIDFLGEKYKYHLSSLDYGGIVTENIPEEEANIELAKKIWNYRLYLTLNNETDLIVRKGDIVEKENNLYLVISADCDLARFWNKNSGVLNVVPMHLVSKENNLLLEKLTIVKSPSDIKNRLVSTSFSNTISAGLSGALVLPFIKRNDSFSNYVCFPKEITHWQISKPDISKRELSNISLGYNRLVGVQRVCNISEPFLTPMLSHLLNTVYGYGTPDYPKTIMSVISNETNILFQ